MPARRRPGCPEAKVEIKGTGRKYQRQATEKSCANRESPPAVGSDLMSRSKRQMITAVKSHARAQIPSARLKHVPVGLTHQRPLMTQN
jgi:hypothetical protein